MPLSFIDSQTVKLLDNLNDIHLIFNNTDCKIKMQLHFQKLKPNRVFQHVVDQIQQAIINGSLKAGDVLPSEMKLKDMFATSRGTIREALRVLEQKGLIEIKTGVSGGAVVQDIGTEVIAESLGLLIQYQKVSYDHLAEFRQCVEGMITALAANKRSPDDISRLKVLLLKAEKQIAESRPDTAAFVQTDIQIHITIAEIVNNPVFTAVLQMVHENILQSHERFSLRSKKVLQENLRDLQDIIAAIEEQDADRARGLAEKHVRQFTKHMQKEHQQLQAKVIRKAPASK